MQKVGDQVLLEDSHIIDGIHLDVKGSELIEHAKARAEFHGKRADFYKEEADKLRKVQDEIPDGKGGKGSYTRDPVGECLEAMKAHRHKHLFFAFCSTHFIEGFTYRISTGEMSTMELGQA